MINKKNYEKSDKSKKVTNGNLNSSPEKLSTDKRKKKNVNKSQQLSENNSQELLNDSNNFKEKTFDSGHDDSFFDDLVGFYSENDHSRPDGVLELRIPNISKFKDIDFRSETKILSPDSIIIRCLPWKILFMLRIHQDRTQRCMGFFLQCNAKCESTVWHCYARAELRLVAQRSSPPTASQSPLPSSITNNTNASSPSPPRHTQNNNGTNNMTSSIASTNTTTSSNTTIMTCNDLVKNIEHIFYYRENDWGYSNYILWSELTNPEKGYIGPDDSVLLRVKVQADAPHGIDWDSKKHTGFVGLKNQGATCYMNSLLQALYFTNKLRSAVYQLPTETDDEQRSVSLALQRVFYELQFGDHAVGTKRLTKSFGWETLDTFMQHDAQELCRVLLDNLECKMKGTRVEDTIPALFCGKMMSFIRCKSVPVESKREEAFYDIQLKVKGNKNIYQAFDEYITIETLDGENKYDAGEFGMQDAEKGIAFLKFPPVLYLQLMRFQYDYEADANIKINDRFDFPYSLDLTKYLHESSDDLAPPSSITTSNKIIYILHTVLVHSGDNHGGHYVAYLNPTGRNEWYKFDDDVVSRCSRKDALISNYGGNYEENSMKHCTSAYMLVYMRESEIHDLLRPIEDEDIPHNLHERFENEKYVEDQKRKEKANAHLYSTAILLLDEDFYGWQGYALFDLDKYTYWRKVRYPRKATAFELTQIVAKFLNEKVDRIRLWSIISKNNQIHLNPLDGKDSLPLLENSNSNFNFNTNNSNTNNATTNSSTTMIYVQIMIPLDQSISSFDPQTNFLVFLKYYNSQRQTIHYMGWIIHKKSQPLLSHTKDLASFCNILCTRAKLPIGTPLLIWEEKERKQLSRVGNLYEPLHSFYNGITLVYEQDQISNKSQLKNNYGAFNTTGLSSWKPFMNASEFLEDYSYRIEVEFIEKISELTQRNSDNTPNPIRVVIRLSQKSRYMDIVKALVSHIKGCEVVKIQLYRASTATTTITNTSNTQNQTQCVTNTTIQQAQQQNQQGVGNNNNINNSNKQNNESNNTTGNVSNVTRTQLISVPGDPIRTTFEGCLGDLVGGINGNTVTSMNATLPRGKPGPPIVTSMKNNNQTVLSSLPSQQGNDSNYDDNVNIGNVNSPPSPPEYRCTYSQPTSQISTNQSSAARILYFRRLRISINEVETMHQINCLFTDLIGRIQLEVSVSLAKSIQIMGSDLLREALKQARLLSNGFGDDGSDGGGDMKNWRLFEVVDHRIMYQIPLNKRISDLQPNPNRVIHIEPIRKGEEILDPKSDLLISVCHGQLQEVVPNYHNNITPSSNQYKYFGVPFSFIIHDNEPIQELRERIRRRLDLPTNNKEFDKWNLVIVSPTQNTPSPPTTPPPSTINTNCTYLISTEDSINNKIKLTMFNGFEEQQHDIIPNNRAWICLDRKLSPATKRPRTAVTEKPIKIHN